MILGTGISGSLAGPFVAACAVLVLAGAAKIAHPAPARVAARAAGIRVPQVAVVAFGILEVGVAVAGATLGGPAAWAVAGAYLFLSFVAIRLLVRAPATPCACLGSTSAVVTPGHVVIDVAAVTVATVAGFGGSPWAQLSGRWVAGAAFVVLAAVCVKLTQLMLETLPALSAATKEGAT